MADPTVGPGCAGMSSLCVRCCLSMACRSDRRLTKRGSPRPRHDGSSVTPSWSRSSPQHGQTRRASSSRRWGHASCGSGCVARAAMSPGARWRVDNARKRLAGRRVRIQAQVHPRRPPPCAIPGSGGPPPLRRGAHRLCVADFTYVSTWIDSSASPSSSTLTADGSSGGGPPDP